MLYIHIAGHHQYPYVQILHSASVSVTTPRLYLGTYNGNDVYLVLDSQTGGVHVVNAGLYADSFITAGGAGSSGGGGGIVDQIHRIGELGETFSDSANDVFNAYTVNSLHLRIQALEQHPGGVTSVAGLTGAVSASALQTALGLGALAYKSSLTANDIPSLTTAKISDIETWIGGKGYVTSSGVTFVGLTVPTGLSVSNTPITSFGTIAISFASGYSIPTTSQQSAWSAKQDAIGDLTTIRSNASLGATAYNDLTTVSLALQSLQSQIDSVSARNNYDELTATTLFSDIVTASSAYIESITGSLSGNVFWN